MIIKDADLCLHLLNDQCKTIVGDMKDVIGMLSKEKASQDELLVKSKKSGSLKEFAQKGFHKYNIARITRFATSRAVESGAKFGLDDIESLYFVNDFEKGITAKDIMKNFDKYADKGRGKKMDTTAIAEFVCWTGLGLRDGYSYFSSKYNGKYDLPQKKSVWSCINANKKAESEKEDGYIERKFASDFEKRMNKRSSI